MIERVVKIGLLGTALYLTALSVLMYPAPLLAAPAATPLIEVTIAPESRPTPVALKCGKSQIIEIPPGSIRATGTYTFPSDSRPEERTGANCCMAAQANCLAQGRTFLYQMTPDPGCKKCGKCRDCHQQLQGCAPEKTHEGGGGDYTCTHAGDPPISSCSVECWNIEVIKVTLKCTECSHSDGGVQSSGGHSAGGRPLASSPHPNKW
jgi:hypothetical protein